MISLKRFVTSEPGKILISIILGLGLSTIFRKTCKEMNCIRFMGIAPEKVNDKIYKFNGKCYKYNNEAVTCDSKKKTVRFE